MSDVDCRKVIENLYLLLDRELSEMECRDLDAHIEACRECFGRYGVEREFKELIHRVCSEEEVPAALVERIRSTLRREASA